jgi:hypothetical protein
MSTRKSFGLSSLLGNGFQGQSTGAGRNFMFSSMKFPNFDNQRRSSHSTMGSSVDGYSPQPSNEAILTLPQIQWAFPQYSQSWAFAPPVAPPYVMPPPFDKKQYK